MSENPFDHFDIDPRAGPTEITARFRMLIEDAKTDEEREALREAWEHLTLHPRDRLIAALSTFPETRAEIPAGIDGDERATAPKISADDLEISDLLAPPLVSAALATSEKEDATREPESLADDPIIVAYLGAFLGPLLSETK